VDADSFVVQRRDGLYSYHLAVVVDDAFQQVSHIVRGRDLLESTPCHLRLQALLGLPRPVYAHLPLVLNGDGQKLSKQSHAPALDDSEPGANLRRCLAALGQATPGGDTCGVEGLLEQALAGWDAARIPHADIPEASLTRR
jgi:glutamyl-Q tRNA(Asp) synthetase